jgi:hypothetical protein
MMLAITIGSAEHQKVALVDTKITGEQEVVLEGEQEVHMEEVEEYQVDLLFRRIRRGLEAVMIITVAEIQGMAVSLLGCHLDRVLVGKGWDCPTDQDRRDRSGFIN